MLAHMDPPKTREQVTVPRKRGSRNCYAVDCVDVTLFEDYFMPKPAKNDYQVVTGAGVINYVYLNSAFPPSTSSNTRTVGVESESYPATMNGTRVNGFTLPLPWSHSGRNIEAWPGGSVVTHSPGLGSTITQVTENGIEASHQANGFPSLQSGEESNCRSIAEIKALQRLKNQHVNVALFFAEAHKSVNLIAGYVNDILQLYRRYRSSPVGRDLYLLRDKGPRQLSKDAARRLLELQYGVRPLMADICGAIDQMSDTSRTRPRVFVIGKSTASTSTLTSHNWTSAPSGFGGSIKRRTDYVTRAKVRLDYEMADPQLATAEQLGLINGLELLWELVPYGFVADWMVPVGDWLSSLTATLGWSFISGSCSIETKLSSATGPLDITYVQAGKKVISNTVFGSSFSGYDFGRTVYNSSPIPGLPVKNPVSAEHALNAVALLRNLFR